MPIILALLFDIVFGDPPNRYHPTAWMGNFIAYLMRFRPHGNRFKEMTYGLLILVAGFFLTISAGWLISYFCLQLPFWIGILLQAAMLKVTISLRGLGGASKEVQTALAANNLPEARRLLSWHLVSRETSELDEAKVCAAAVESVAENASDGIIAPLFYFALGGLPAVFAYRFANTADSMLGYHDVAHEWLGKIPARLDDVLNFIPARLTGLFIVLAAFLTGSNARLAWIIMLRDAKNTASPNAGLPMSAMAGALGVDLEKIDHYTLGAGLRAPGPADIAQARRLMYGSVILAAGVFTLWRMYAYQG